MFGENYESQRRLFQERLKKLDGSGSWKFGAAGRMQQKRRMVRVFLISIALLAGASVNAAEWYVATGGNDRNAGTVAAPFATLNRTESVVKPGDTVYVRGGTYRQRVSLRANGTAEGRITYRPYRDERVILDASGLKEPNGRPANGVTLGGNYVDWTGFEIRNAPNIGLVNWGGHDQRLLDNVIHGSVRGAIWIGEDTFGLVHHVLIDGNRIYDNVLHNKERKLNGGWAQTIGVGRGNHITITNNVVYRNYGEGIVVSRTDNSRVANNEVFDNYSVNIYLSHAQNCVVDGNLVYSTLDRNYYRRPNYPHPAHGIALANEWNGLTTNATTGNEVVNNVILRAEWGIGFWKDINETGANSMTNCRFSNNTVIAPTRYAVHFDPDTNHRGVVVENNLFALPSGSQATLVDMPTDSPGITYRNNKTLGTGQAGSEIGRLRTRLPVAP